MNDQPSAGPVPGDPREDSARTGPFPPVTSPGAPGRPPAATPPSTGEFPILPTPFPAGPASGAPTFPPGPAPYPPPAPFHQMTPGSYPPPATGRSPALLIAIVGGAVAVLLVLVCGAVVLARAAGPGNQPQAARPPVDDATAAPAAGTLDCGLTTVAAPPRAPGPPDLSTAPQAGAATLRIITDLGVLTVAMDRAKTPCTVASYAHLARTGFLSGTACHRLVTEGIFVLQCGDPLGNGQGTPGYAFRDENLAGARYARGVVAMANAGPGTNGSQFFIVYADSLTLPPLYTPFGTVTAGLDVVERVAGAGVADGATDGAPRMKMTLRSVTVTG